MRIPPYWAASPKPVRFGGEDPENKKTLNNKRTLRRLEIAPLRKEDDWRRKMDLSLTIALAGYEKDKGKNDQPVHLLLMLKAPATAEAMQAKFAELGVQTTTIVSDILTARTTLGKLEAIARLDEVQYLEGARRLGPAAP